MADIQELKPIQTAHGLLEIYKDWDCEGAIYMKNPRTLRRYHQISDEEPDCDKYGIFWAFGGDQFDNGYKKLVQLGHIKDGDKVVRFGSGGFAASKEHLDKFYAFYDERDKKVAAECDPQEVYLYEYNNYECMIGFDGDEQAYNVVVRIFGEETAKKVKRFGAW